jgi:hypothetical protein
MYTLGRPSTVNDNQVKQIELIEPARDVPVRKFYQFSTQNPANKKVQVYIEIKNDFNTELFTQPLLCDELGIDNTALAAVIGHEPLAPDLAATCGFETGQGELLAFRHLYSYDFSLMSADVMGAVYESLGLYESSQKLLEKALDMLYEDIVLPLGGSVTAEHGIGLAKAKYLPQEIDAGTLRMMREIRMAGFGNVSMVLPNFAAKDGPFSNIIKPGNKCKNIIPVDRCDKSIVQQIRATS